MAQRPAASALLVVVVMVIALGGGCVSGKHMGVISADDLGNMHINASVDGARVLVSGMDVVEQVASLQASNTALEQDNQRLQATLDSVAASYAELARQHTQLARAFWTTQNFGRGSAFSTSMTLRFIKQFASTASTRVLSGIVTESGAVYLGGYVRFPANVSGTGDPVTYGFLSRFSSVDGSRLWMQTFSPNGGLAFITSIAADDSGRVYAVGGRVASISTHSAWDGRELWRYNVTSSPVLPLSSARLAVSRDGRTVYSAVSTFDNVVILALEGATGTLNQGGSLFRLRQSDGSAVWVQSVNATSGQLWRGQPLTLAAADTPCMGLTLPLPPGDNNTPPTYIQCFAADTGAIVGAQIPLPANFTLFSVLSTWGNDIFAVGTATDERRVLDHDSIGGADVVAMRVHMPSGYVYWSEQLGSAEDEQPPFAGVDGSGSLYIMGSTGGTLPSTGLPPPDSSDAYLVKYTPAHLL